MPTIPRAQTTNLARPTETIPSAAAATAPSRAFAQLGQAAESLGTRLVQEKTEADNAAFVTEKLNSQMRRESERLADVETRGIDVDLKENETRWNDEVKLSLEGAPSQEAQTELSARLGAAFNSKFAPSYNRHQTKLDVRKRFNSTQSALDDIQSEVLTGRTTLAEALGRSEAAIVGLAATSGGVVDIDKLRASNNNQIATNLLSGRIDKGQGGSVIKEINAGQWDKLTDSKTLGKILRAAKADVKQRAGAAKVEFTKGFGDYMAFVAAGNEDDALADKFSPDNISAVFGKKAPQIIEALNDARDFGETKNEIATASPEELRSLIEDNRPTSPTDFKREARQFGILNEAVKQRNKNIAADPALYSIQNSTIAEDAFERFNEAMQGGDQGEMAATASEYTSIQRSIQEDLGVGSKSVAFLPKKMEDSIAKSLNDFSQGGEAAAIQLESIKSAFGNEWGAIQRQLVNSGKVSGTFAVTAGMDFGPEQINVLEATSVNQKTYKDVIGDDDFKTIKADTISELDEFQDTLRGQPGGDRVFREHKMAIESTAMKYVADLNLSPSEAIEKATDDVLNKRFSFVDTYRVPQEFNPDDISVSVDRTIDNIKEGGFDLSVPFSDQIGNDEDRRSVYLAKIQPTPITEPGGTGIMFVDQNNKAILLNDGTPVIKTWLELERETLNLQGTVEAAIGTEEQPGPLSDLGLTQ